MAELTYDQIASQRHPGGGTSRIDRHSADSARSVVESYFEKPQELEFVCGALRDIFEALDEQGHELGSVTLFNNRLHVNAGRILLAAVNASAILVQVDEDSVDDQVLAAFEAQTKVEEFGSVGRCLTIYVLPEKSELWPSLVSGIKRMIERAYADRSKTMWPKSHSPGVIDLLAEETGLDIDDRWQRAEAASPGSRQTIPGFIEFMKGEDPAHYRKVQQEFDAKRSELLARFGPDAWPGMTLEDYALGTNVSRSSFCYFMEFDSIELGGIGGGGASKHLIYKRSSGEWYFPPQYDSVKDAWSEVRRGFQDLVDTCERGDFERVDELERLSGANVLRTKYAATLYPDAFVSVASEGHLRKLHEKLGTEEENDKSAGPARLNRRLVEALREYDELDKYTSHQLTTGLYKYADPRTAERNVKIAPGQQAEIWEECQRDGNIRVGWDDVGDLRQFESKGEFRDAFGRAYPDYDKSKVTKKSNELWMLMHLQPGDQVFANDGISKVLAKGTVIEPGYQYLADEYERYVHAVHVEWDTSYEQQIEPQPYWAMTTVDELAPALVTLIMSKTGDKVQIFDPFLDSIADALESKKQAVLYGPPGTGKTHYARRFALWWLGKHDAALKAALGSPDLFSKYEREFAVENEDRQSWVVVANPTKQDWRWGLMKEGPQKFYEGQLKRNYSKLRKGDLVFGYEAGKAKAIVAICRVARAFGVAMGDEVPTFEIELLSEVEDGPTFHELTNDQNLQDCEAIRNRMQGTLFRISEDESLHLQSLIAEKNPSLEEQFQTSSGAQQITRVTFHPSYAYEDFVEGYRPVDSGGEGLQLALEDGVFKRVCREASIYPDRKFLLMIDELNRGNVAKIFGELITLLESDKRGMPIRLPQSKETFSVPENVYILATMNTADRSLRHLDAALRRRFQFIEMMPDYRVLRGATVRNLPLAGFLEELNRQVIAFEGREKQIGHSYLLDGGEPVTVPDEFAKRFRMEILPLLQEYCFDDYEQLAELFGSLVDAESQTFDASILNDADRLLEVLEDRFIRNQWGGE